MLDHAQGGFRVVCLAASAGGLDAYLRIFSRLRPDSGMAYIVAQHRSPTSPDLLSRILSRIAAMPVCDMEQGMRIRPDHIYVMPPRTEVTVADYSFILRIAPPSGGWPKTITHLLRSLAENIGKDLVAVILSGMDADGSASLKLVKAAGGITMAQRDGNFDSMPRNAISTGRIDHVLTAHEIAKALNRLADDNLDRLQTQARRMLL